MLTSMRALLLEPPDWFLEQRRKFGSDVRDEGWDGVLHMPPEPTVHHQQLSSALVAVLLPLAKRRGLVASCETAFGPGRYNYRVPDVIVYAQASATKSFVVGPAELAIEILSPQDESRDKLPFYASRGVKEVWLLDPTTRAVEVYTLRGDTYFAIADREHVIRAPALDLQLATIDGPKLQIIWADGSAEI